MDKILGITLLILCGTYFVQQMYYFLLCGMEAIKNAETVED